MHLQFLKSLGLSDKESELYEILLSKGVLPASQLITLSKLKRATAYKVLYALEAKGLIKHEDINKKIHFKPEPPSQLLAFAENHIQSLERVREDLRNVIPQLTSTYILSIEKPVISTFEGVSGLKEIYEDTLREGKEIYAVLQTAEVNPEMYDWLTTEYVKKRSKVGIKASVIVASGKWSEKYQESDQKENRETRLVPSDRFPFQHEVNVYGDKVAFINYKKGEALIGVVINHPHIAKTMKSWFDLAWVGAESIKK